LVDVTGAEGNVLEAEGRLIEALVVQDAVGEPSGNPGVVVTKQIVVVVVASTADVTTVKAFVGQSVAPEAHWVTVKYEVV
jgi:hypothetical protein